MKKAVIIFMSFLWSYAGLNAQVTLNFGGGFLGIVSGMGTQFGTITLSDGLSYRCGAEATGGFTFSSRNTFDQIIYTQSGALSYFSFGRTDGSEFQLDNVNIEFNIANITSAVITGFLDGVAVGGAVANITFSQMTAQTVDVSSNVSFDNIDEIRITFPSAPDNNATTQLNSLQYSTAVLPVELVRFDGEVKGGAVHLAWETASEINNEKFVIERSTDARIFEALGEIVGHGTASEAQRYAFVDRQAPKGIHYYRLKQMDTNGQFEYSPILSFRVAATTLQSGTLYPNPSTDGQTYLDYFSDTEKVLTIQVFDGNGRLVRESRSSVAIGENQLQLDYSDLSPGIYTLRFGAANALDHSQKLILK